ncbi:MAG: hypothetical protein ACOH17_14230 [Cellulomonas sp.]
MTRTDDTRALALTPLDRELVLFLARFTYGRGAHLVGWTGASPDGVRKSIRRLLEGRFIARETVAADLRDSQGHIRSTTTTVYRATKRGANQIGRWRIPGTELTVHVEPLKPSTTMANHILGVADLAVWYRRHGLDVGGEREVLSVEKPTVIGVGAKRQLVSHWTISIPGKVGVHPPDAVAVGQDGSMWALELERTRKTVQEYSDVIAAYRAVGIGQVWHVLGRTTAEALWAGAALAGVRWGPSPYPGANVSTDGLVRLQGWAPSRSLGRTSSWAAAGMWPTSSPAGLPVGVTGPVVLDAWRQGTVVDPDAVALWEPLKMVA